MRPKRWLAVPVLGLLLTAGGCGRDVLVVGERAVDVVATGGGEGAAPAGAPHAGAFVAPDAPVGVVEFEVRASLVRGGTAAPVNTTPVETLVLIDGTDVVRVTEGTVPATDYESVRLVFTRVDAQVDGGLVVGGVELTGQVRVGIAAGDSVVVERPFPVPAGEAEVRLIVRLDAPAWLAAADPVARTVPAGTFASAVTVGSW